MMWPLLVAAVAVAGTVCVTGAAMPQAVSPLNGRIVNGQPAEPGEFPAQLSLMRNGAHWCGASIIAGRWAVTAAHCVDSVDSYDVMEVRAGVTNLKEEGSLHQVDVITIHPEYDPSDSWVNDIALLKVSPAFPVDDVTVAPVKLPAQGEEVPDGANVTVVGWGNLWYQGPSSDDLQKVDLHKWNQQVCASIWGDYGYPIYPSQICAARFEDINYGTCNGDSGGPVLYRGSLAGLTSWGYECASPPYPGVYTRVASYVDWIQHHLSAPTSSGIIKFIL